MSKLRAPVAIADQGEPEAAGVREVVAGEQLDLEPLCPLETPGRRDDPLREHGLERALRRQLLDQRRLERSKRSGILALPQHDVLVARASRA